ncbi:hypothetical protein [Psychrobacter immobilis]|nr:hypothetical protein [Psychrobacter immobilis]
MSYSEYIATTWSRMGVTLYSSAQPDWCEVAEGMLERGAKW